MASERLNSAAGETSGAARAPSTPRAVVFDLDGLLLNTEDLYQDVGSELLGRRGRSFEADLLDAMMGRPPRISLRIMIDWHGLDDTPEALALETEEIFATVLDHKLALMPGAAELLAALEARQIPRAIATSSGRRFVDNVLGRFGLAPRFSFVLTSDDVVECKPHPEIYLTAAARLGLSPQNILVLEDSPTGCRAAVAAGATVIAVPTQHSRGHDFPGAHLIVESLRDARIAALLGLA